MEEEENSDVSFWRVIKLNKPEWKSVSVASLCSLISGFSMPLLAVVLGNFVDVSYVDDFSTLRYVSY